MSQAAAAASAGMTGMGGGAGSNFMVPGSGFGGSMGAATRLAMGLGQQAMNDNKAAASAKARASARGLGGGMGKRIGSIESRLDALEGGGESGGSVQSVKPVQEFSTGGSFGDVPSAPPAPVAAGSLNASASPGSLQEAMPSPGNPAADMFGNEFMRNASVGAAKMRMNKKI